MQSLTPGGSLAKKGSSNTPMCWTEARGETFNLRAPGYKTLCKKQASGASLYETVTVDAYSSPKKVPHFAQYVNLGPDRTYVAGVPANLVINLMLPRYAPNLMWSAAGDGESWCVIFYCRLSEESRRLLLENRPSPALSLWKRFCEADRADPLKQRLKAIIRGLNVADVAFSTATRTLINKYNAKPFMIRTTSIFFTGDNYYEIDIDVHRFGKTARIGLYGASEVATQMEFEFSLVIQGETDDELPEQLLMGTRLERLDPSVVNTLPFQPVPVKMDSPTRMGTDETVFPDD